MQPYYSEMLHILMDILRRAEGLARVTLARFVAERAVAVCPQDDEFWDFLEEIERIANNHAAASHVRWRKEQRKA